MCFGYCSSVIEQWSCLYLYSVCFMNYKSGFNPNLYIEPEEWQSQCSILMEPMLPLLSLFGISKWNVFLAILLYLMLANETIHLHVHV